MPISKYFYVTYIYYTREEVVYFVYFFQSKWDTGENSYNISNRH